MNKSWLAHYKNKYPGGHVDMSETSIDVYDADGAHRVAIRKNGAGQWACVSEELGASDAHDLAPIPRDARVHKIEKNANGVDVLGRDEFAQERESARAEFDDGSGRIMSMDEMRKQNKEYQFDDKGRVVSRPSKNVSSPEVVEPKQVSQSRARGGLNL